MKTLLFAFSFLFQCIASFGQANMSFIAYPEPSPVQADIWQLEAKECAAMLKWDTTTLQQLWSRDFTADFPLKEVITIAGKRFPNYSYISRTNQTLRQIDDTVYLSGEESIMLISDESNPRRTMVRHYTHLWRKENGSWKLKNKFISAVKD